MPHLPLAPLLHCKQGSVNAPWCDFSWRIERLDGTLVSTTIDRVARGNERIVARCRRCGEPHEPRGLNP